MRYSRERAENDPRLIMSTATDFLIRQLTSGYFDAILTQFFFDIRD